MLLADMTFAQFLQNPTGPYSSFFGKRENIKLDLEQRYNQLLSKQKPRNPSGFIKNIYLENKKDYYFVFSIPSEKFDSLYYDVVIRFFPKTTAVAAESTLLNYNIQFFSNSPAFVYTYAYISNKDKLLIPFLKGKLNKLSLTQAPTVKNPVEIYGFEKSIYFSLLYIKSNGLHVKSMLSSKVEKFNQGNIKKSCRKSDEIQELYNNEKMKEKIKKDNLKKENKKTKIENNNNVIRERNEKRNKVITPKHGIGKLNRGIRKIKPKKKK